MSTPRIVRAKKQFLTVLERLFIDFPDLQWFRNNHDGNVYLDRTVSYIGHWSLANNTFQMEYLTKELNGPVLYYGRNADGRLFMFASNTLAPEHLNWMISVEKPDHFMVAVFNTMAFQAGLLPSVPTVLLNSSMGVSNSEEPAQEVVNWLIQNMDNMPARLADACDRARLYRY